MSLDWANSMPSDCPPKSSQKTHKSQKNIPNEQNHPKVMFSVILSIWGDLDEVCVFLVASAKHDEHDGQKSSKSAKPEKAHKITKIMIWAFLRGFGSWGLWLQGTLAPGDFGSQGLLITDQHVLKT